MVFEKEWRVENIYFGVLNKIELDIFYQFYLLINISNCIYTLAESTRIHGYKEKSMEQIPSNDK